MLDTAVWSLIEQLLQQPDLFPTKRVQSQKMIVGDGRLAAEAVLAKATQLGFLAQILTTRLEGEARQVGGFVAAIAQDTPPGRCLILAGETTVTVRGNGQGGRNQELALAAALALRGCADTAVISVATDGEAGTTGAAGAVVSGETAVRAGKRELDPRRFLNENDSYSFFQQLDDKMQDEEPAHLIRTGPTGTNVNDLIIILTY
jgi:hydroxypyruvate reductase